jgi:hypothetical protein
MERIAFDARRRNGRGGTTDRVSPLLFGEIDLMLISLGRSKVWARDEVDSGIWRIVRKGLNDAGAI